MTADAIRTFLGRKGDTVGIGNTDTLRWVVGDPTAFFYTSAKLDAGVVTDGGSGSNHFTELAFTSLLASQGFIWKLRVRIENLLSLKQFLKLGDPFF